METALGVLVTAVVVGIAGLVVLAIWRARVADARLGSVLVVAWLALALVLSALGVFIARADSLFPAIALGITPPLLAGYWFLRRSQFLGAIPVDSLIRFQGFRIAGALFLAYLAAGLLPREFALPAGIGDVLVGLSALLVARRVKNAGPERSRRLAVAWNMAGLVDFAIAVGTGFLTSPSPFQLPALDAPNTMITAFPLALIPTFAVPLFAVLHVACLRRLLAGSSSAQPHQGLTAGFTAPGSDPAR